MDVAPLGSYKEERRHLEKRGYWSGSCSSCSRYGVGSDIFMSNTTIGENPSKQPRTVIILPGEDNETRELDKDKHKEEMTYDDDDDYPSSRSNGSNDGLNNMEKRPIEDEKREDYAASNIEANEITESDKEKNEVSRVIIDSVSGDDLETILRQKALENIKSFRSGLGRSQAAAKSAVIQKDKHDGAVEALSPVMPELGQIKSSKSNLTRIPGEDYAHFLQHEKIPNGGICGSESSSARNNPEANQAKLASGTSLGKGATLKEAPAPLEANQAKLRGGSNVVKNATHGAHTVTSPTSPIVNGNDASVSTPAEPSVCIASSAGDITLNKSLDEGKEGSQLEQKTTSVTRGGGNGTVTFLDGGPHGRSPDELKS
ncbi:hypothetical protein Peur_000638 [Populus x canadensis]